MPAKLHSIQALRGLAALLVTFSHLRRIEEKYAGDPLLPALFEHGVAGVDLFFVISGFIMVAITRDQPRGHQAAAHFLRRRLLRILPLYWLYTAVVLAVALLRPSWVNQSSGHHYDLVASLLLIPHAGNPLVNVAWTLEHEMYFYLVFGALIWLTPARWLGACLGAWVCATATAALLLPLPTAPLLALLAKPYALEFVAGCAIGMLLLGGNGGYDRRAAWGLLALSASVGAIAIGARLLGTEGAYTKTIDVYFRVLQYGAPSAALVAAALMLERRGVQMPRWLCAVGDGSYSIYLSHVLVLSAAGRIWAQFARTGATDNLVMLPLCVGLAVAAGLLSYHVIERPLLDLLQRRRNRVVACGEILPS